MDVAKIICATNEGKISGNDIIILPSNDTFSISIVDFNFDILEIRSPFIREIMHSSRDSVAGKCSIFL